MEMIPTDDEGENEPMVEVDDDGDVIDDAAEKYEYPDMPWTGWMAITMPFLIAIGFAVWLGIKYNVEGSPRTYYGAVCDTTSGYANCTVGGRGYPCTASTTPSRLCRGLDNCNPYVFSGGVCGNGTCQYNSSYMTEGYFACRCNTYNYPDANGQNCVYHYP